MNFKQHIRQIADFPKPGINFFDISTLIRHAEAWRSATSNLIEATAGWAPDLYAAIDARGFLVASPIAVGAGRGLVMVRKRGKLPGEVRRAQYGLEYGTDEVEIQIDAVAPGQKVVIVDDLLATGGTIVAATRLLREAGADVVGAACVIELAFLNGREKLGLPFASLVSYDSE